MSTIRASLLLLASVCAAGPSWAETPPEDPSASAPEISWTTGPASGALGAIASIRVPDGYALADGDDTRRIMEALENPATGTEVGFLKPIDEDWFVVFEYDESGHVKDDEKDSIDADAILASLREGNEAGNEERRKRGWETIELVGWMQPPHYDEATHNLEWATRARAAGGGESMNFNTRLLGRTGVMRVTLVGAPEDLDVALPKFRALLGGYDFNPGQRYAEYRSGDKLAEYGLTALIAGGVGAGLAKSGLLGKLWKFLAVGAIALAGAAKRLFGRGSSKA